MGRVGSRRNGFVHLRSGDGAGNARVPGEVFKILDGKIRMIDNIGLKAEGMQAVPFAD
jgi:hypothetical protein